MGTCSNALYSCLTTDLSRVFRTLPLERLERNVREALWPGASFREVASAFLLDSIFKKFEDNKSSKADDVALAKFIAANSHCERSCTIDTHEMTEIQSIALGEFRKSFYDFWFINHGRDYFFNTSDVLERINVGPGASIGATGTSFYHKIAAGPLTGTNYQLFHLYKGEAAKFPLWDETEKIRFNHFGGMKQVIGSRLSFVPKSNDVSRTICTEPLLNMLFQKGLGSLFESRLKGRFGINLSTQPDKNRELCRIGSETGDFGTIDLSSASDTISLKLLQEILPSYILGWIKETRCQFVTLPNGKPLALQMVSSMGNAYTFPLQTILFSCVVIGVYKALGLELIYPRGEPEDPDYQVGNFSVFGDDIIVRREAYNLVVNILERIGFLVNRDKSYNEGVFRESCGVDFYAGYNVRGIYCQSLKSKQDVYSLINRLNMWSANHGIPIPITIQYLMQSSGVKLIPVPPWESDVAGIKMPLRLVPTLSIRKHREFQGSIIYYRYLSRPLSTCLLDIGTRLKMRHKGRDLIHNPAGVLFSAIGGYLRDGNLLSNREVARYEKRFAIAPCWDYFGPSVSSNLTKLGWRNWLNFSVETNLELG